MTRRIDKPRPGFFALKLVKGGAEVGAAIFRPCLCTIHGPEQHEWRATCDRFPLLRAVLNGEDTPVMRVWLYGREIDEAEYEYLCNDAAWAQRHAPDDPRANPTTKVDLRKQPPIF